MEGMAQDCVPSVVTLSEWGENKSNRSRLKIYETGGLVCKLHEEHIDFRGYVLFAWARRRAGAFLVQELIPGTKSMENNALLGAQPILSSLAPNHLL